MESICLWGHGRTFSILEENTYNFISTKSFFLIANFIHILLPKKNCTYFYQSKNSMRGGKLKLHFHIGVWIQFESGKEALGEKNQTIWKPSCCVCPSLSWALCPLQICVHEPHGLGAVVKAGPGMLVVFPEKWGTWQLHPREQLHLWAPAVSALSAFSSSLTFSQLSWVPHNFFLSLPFLLCTEKAKRQISCPAATEHHCLDNEEELHMVSTFSWQPHHHTHKGRGSKWRRKEYVGGAVRVTVSPMESKVNQAQD